jgi:hypothetical protein
MLNEKEIALMGLAEAATAGPWGVVLDTYVVPADQMNRKIGCSTNAHDDYTDYAHQICKTDSKYLTNNANAAFIAAANPSAIITLLRQLDAARFSAAQHLQTVETQAKIIAGYAAPSAQQAASIDTDELHFNAQRLRNVAALAGCAIMPEVDDFDVDSSRGAYLGIIASKLRERADTPAQPIAPPVTPRHIEEIKDLLLWPVTEDYARTARDMLQSLHFDLSMADPAAQPIADVSAPTDEDELLALVPEHEIMKLWGMCAYWGSVDTRVVPFARAVIRSALAARAAAPVSGQGASIDTTEFRKMIDGVFGLEDSTVESSAYTALVAHIDSRAARMIPTKCILPWAESLPLCVGSCAKRGVCIERAAWAPSVPDSSGDAWHSLTCDGTCYPPCKDAPPQLPPLPEAIEVGGEGWDWEDFQSEKTYSGDHMRAYGQLCIDSRPRSEDSRVAITALIERATNDNCRILAGNGEWSGKLSVPVDDLRRALAATAHVAAEPAERAATQPAVSMRQLLLDARWRITNKNTATDDYKRLDAPVVDRIDAALSGNINAAGNEALAEAAKRVQTAAYNFNASKFVLGSAEHHAAATEYQASQDNLIRIAIAGNLAAPISEASAPDEDNPAQERLDAMIGYDPAWNPVEQADSSSAAPSDFYQVYSGDDGVWYGVTREQWDRANPKYRRLAAPSPTGESLSTAAVHAILVKHLGWVGGPDWCDEARGICADLAALATPRQTEGGGVPEAVRIGVEAAFEEKAGWRTKIAAAVRALAASPAPTGESK